jgi:flagellar protein FliO/FliZ
MSSRARRLFAALLVVGMTVAARAVDESKVIFPGGGSHADAPAVAGGGGLNSITLVVGLALAGVGGWLVWRNRRGVPVSRDTRALAIEETRSLGNRQYLVVASHRGKKFLLGVCPGQINLLSALAESDEGEESRK